MYYSENDFYSGTVNSVEVLVVIFLSLVPHPLFTGLLQRAGELLADFFVLQLRF